MLNEGLNEKLVTETLTASHLNWNDAIDIPKGSTYARTFYHVNEKYAFFVQFVYSKMGWSPTLQISSRLYSLQDDKKYCKSVSLDPSKYLEISSDGHDCKVDTILEIKMIDQETLTYHVNFTDAELSLDFEFVPLVDGFQLKGDSSKIGFMKDAPDDGCVLPRFIPKAKITGTALLKGGKRIEIDGSGNLVSALQIKPQTIARWNFVNFHNENDALMVYKFNLPSGYDLEEFSISSLVLDNKQVTIAFDTNVIHKDIVSDSFSSYLIPSSINFNILGETFDGASSINIKFESRCKYLCDKIDVLNELPFLLKKFIQAFITAPYIYEWLDETELKVKIGDGEVVTIKGTMFTESTFMMHGNHFEIINEKDCIL